MDNNDLKKWLAEQISYLEKTKEHPDKFAWDPEYDFQLDAFRLALERLETVALDRLQPVRLYGDGAEAFALAAEVSELRQEMEKLKAERDSARHNLATVQKMVQEYQEEIIPGFRERAEKEEKERDAAVAQLHGYCPACKNYTPNHNEGPCEICKHEYYKYHDEKAVDNWEWRGQKEE